MEHGAGAGPQDLNTPLASPPQSPEDNSVVIYGEGVPGNPWRSRHVVRYLLNKPGVALKDASSAFGPTDQILTFDKSHVPAGRTFFEMFMPLVDRQYYHPPDGKTVRSGFVICSKNKPDVPLVVPQWAGPLTFAVPHRLRSHQELGDIYRASRGLIAYRRSTAIYEALACGCPVLAIPSSGFDKETYQPRFRGAGISWDFTEAGLAAATAEVGRFSTIYRAIEDDFPRHLNDTMLEILSIAASRGVTPQRA